MARMIPSILDFECKSPGERETYRRIRDDNKAKGWIVLHSLDLVEHSEQISGEVDFVVIIPNKGVLCLEIKAHKKVCRTENGLWYFGTNPSPDHKGPFKQASSAMHSLRKTLVEKRPDLAQIPFWTAVIFSHAEFSATSTEWHPWQYIDCRTYWNGSLAEKLEKIIDQARGHLAKCATARWFYPSSREPYPEQCEAVLDVLRPSFDFQMSHKLDVEIKSKEIRNFTDEQMQALDAMEENSRVIFSGPAGTGKTFLALEEARRQASGGRKVLLLCYNRHLAEWMKKEVASQTGIQTAGMHQFMKEICGIKGTAADGGAEYWERELPALAAEAMLSRDDVIGRYDSVVIDEAQDLLRGNYLDIIDLSLKGGLAAGHWRLFGDFEKQAIYSAAFLEVSEFAKKRGGDPVRFALRINCRNTPQVAALACLYGGLKPNYKSIRRNDDCEPQTYYIEAERQHEKLVEVMELLYKEGYKGEEIVILSPLASGCAAEKVPIGPWKQRLRNFSLECEKGYVRYATIHAFKGLEAPAIILTDISGIEDEHSQSLIYIGITRALHSLSIIAMPKAKQTMIKALVSGACGLSGGK